MKEIRSALHRLVQGSARFSAGAKLSLVDTDFVFNLLKS